MINAITPTMAKKILSSAADGVIPAKGRRPFLMDKPIPSKLILNN